MPLTRTHRRNLAKLADYLEALPRRYRHFKMASYADGLKDEGQYALKNGGVTGCGAVACAVGHGPAAGIYFRKAEGYVSHLNGKFVPGWESYCERFVPVEFCPEYDWAFGGTWSAYDNHHWGAAARIRYLLKDGLPEGFKWPERKWRNTYRAFDRRYTAQGIAARSDETRSGSAEGKSPVAKPCAQTLVPKD